MLAFVWAVGTWLCTLQSAFGNKEPDAVGFISRIEFGEIKKKEKKKKPHNKIDGHWNRNKKRNCTLTLSSSDRKKE